MTITSFPAVAITIMALCHTSATSLFVNLPQRLLIRAISSKGSACCSNCSPKITRSFHSLENKPATVKFGLPSTECHHSTNFRLFSSTFIPTQLDAIESTCEIATKRDLSKVLHTIEKAAQQAGELALQTAGKIAVKSTKTNSRDLVTESDLECQRIIREVILGEFPTDVFLGEEDVNLSTGSGSESSSSALRGALGLVEREENDDKLLFIVVISIVFLSSSSVVVFAMHLGDFNFLSNIFLFLFDFQFRIQLMELPIFKQVSFF